MNLTQELYDNREKMNVAHHSLKTAQGIQRQVLWDVIDILQDCEDMILRSQALSNEKYAKEIPLDNGFGF